MKCESVEGKRLPDVHGDDDETGLWKQKPGSWRWRLGGWKGARVLEAVLPSRYPEGPGLVHPHQHCACPVMEGNSPNEQTWGWDGNEEAPTLNGSIMVDTNWGPDRVRVFWHGYLEAGFFRACE